MTCDNYSVSNASAYIKDTIVTLKGKAVGLFNSTIAEK